MTIRCTLIALEIQILNRGICQIGRRVDKGGKIFLSEICIGDPGFNAFCLLKLRGQVVDLTLGNNAYERHIFINYFLNGVLIISTALGKGIAIPGYQLNDEFCYRVRVIDAFRIYPGKFEGNMIYIHADVQNMEGNI